MSKSYYKLEVESSLWRAFKAKCASRGKTMLEALTDLIKQYIAEK